MFTVLKIDLNKKFRKSGDWLFKSINKKKLIMNNLTIFN